MAIEIRKATTAQEREQFLQVLRSANDRMAKKNIVQWLPCHLTAEAVFEPGVEPYLLEERKAKKAKANRISASYARLLAAEQRLHEVILHNQGGANKDIAKFADQLISLCDKWDR